MKCTSQIFICLSKLRGLSFPTRRWDKAPFAALQTSSVFLSGSPPSGLSIINHASFIPLIELSVGLSDQNLFVCKMFAQEWVTGHTHSLHSDLSKSSLHISIWFTFCFMHSGVNREKPAQRCRLAFWITYFMCINHSLNEFLFIQFLIFATVSDWNALFMHVKLWSLRSKI